jgi:hypothetical protein
MATSQKIETSMTFLEIRGDVLYIKIKEDADLDIEAIKESVAARIKLQQGKKMLALVDAKNLWQLSKEANTYSASKEVGELSVAMAILPGASLGIRMIANFFIKINKNHCPAKIFKSEEKALKWLDTFKK